MRQKRQLYQKEIRREAMNSIFRKKRLQHFNYSFQASLKNNQPQNQLNQSQSIINDKAINEYVRYSQEIYQSIKEENMQNLMSLVKESYYELKRLLIKQKQKAESIKMIIDNWFKFSMDQLLISIVKMFEKIDPKSFCAVRKQIFKYSISHFYLVYKYYTAVEGKTKSKQLFNFLFLCLHELSNLPQSIREIMSIANDISHLDKSARHDFFFRNYKQPESQQKLLTFQNICYVMFENKEKFLNSSYDIQQKRFCQIKMVFIEVFKQYAYELLEMKRYIQKIKKQTEKNNKASIIVDQVYEETLRLYSYPSEIVLKQFLQKSVLTLIYQIITEMRRFYFKNWAQSQQNQQNLAYCLWAFRLLIDFYPNHKIIMDFSDQLGELLDLLIMKNLSIQVKRQTLFLLDSIIFIDEKNEITDPLVRYQNLFEKIWSYQDRQTQDVKLNIVNNLLLCTSGFQAVNRHLCEIVVFLNATQKHIKLALTFVANYFSYTSFDLSHESRVNLIVNLLYSLPGDKFSVQEMQQDINILSHLYDKGLRRKLPNRYNGREGLLIGIDNVNSQERDEKFMLVSKMQDIYDDLEKEREELEGIMQYQ